MRKPLLIAALALTAASGSAQTLSVDVTSPTSARLVLFGHFTAWWYKQTSPSAGTCTSVNAGTNQVNISGLSALTRYVYRAYSSAGCSTGPLGFVQFSMPSIRTALRNSWSFAGQHHISPASEVVRLEVNILSERPPYLVTFATSGSLEWWPGSEAIGENCDQNRFFIPTGNGDLGDRAQVLIHERALELLDTVKLALLTKSFVEVVVDVTQNRRFGLRDYCPVVSITLVPKP